jgi:hypothetical protein
MREIPIVAYWGPYDGRTSPFLGQAYGAPAPAIAPAPAPAAATPAAPTAVKPQEESGPPTVQIGGMRISIWSIALAGAVVVAAIAVGAASIGDMRGR